MEEVFRKAIIRDINRRLSRVRWNMIDRCKNPKNKYYHRYGGRGILVCQRWLDSLDNFRKDMFSKFSLESLADDSLENDRINPDGNYVLENIRRVNKKTSMRNLAHHPVRPGMIFGRLTVKDFSERKNKQGNYTYYICECECGTIKEVNRSSLVSGDTVSCGCYAAEKFAERRRKVAEENPNAQPGTRYERWTVMGRGERKTPNGGRGYLLCKCDCGVVKEVHFGSLLAGDSKSCGCLARERSSERMRSIGKKHGGWNKIYD